MADLVIDALEAAGVASSVKVTVELTDQRGDSVTGFVAATDEVIVYPSTAVTDSLGQVTIDLVPNDEIVPGNTCYTVRIQDKQFLIQKSAVPQGLLEALVVDPGELDPIEAGELADHINDPTGAHAASAISVIPFATIESEDVQGALEELFNEASGASTAADVDFVPAGSIEATDVQAAIEEVSGDIDAHVTDTLDAHEASAIGVEWFGPFEPDNVQEAFVDLNDGLAVVSDNLLAHVTATESAHEASAISFVPAGVLDETNVQDGLAEMAYANEAQKEPLGFPNTTDSALSIVDAGATYTFSVTPTGSDFDVWAGAMRYNKTTAQSVSLAKTEGSKYIYFNSSGTLVQTSFKWNWDSDAPVALFYYSPTASGYFYVDERHGAQMDGATQRWLSEVAGSRLTSGLVIGDYTLDPPTPTNADNTFSTTAGTMVDADIQYTLPARPVGGGVGAYGIFYRTGATEWTVTASAVPAAVGTTYIKYNQDVAGTWQLTELASGEFVNYWLLGVPTPAPGGRSYILLPGENVYSTLSGAEAESDVSSVLLASFPFREAISRYRITYQCQSAYSGATGRFRIRAVSELIGRSVTQVASTLSVDHAVLLNRDLDAQHPATSIAFTPTGTIAATDVQAAIEEVYAEAGGGGTADSITFDPAGDIIATDVQAAIEEVDAELHAHETDTVDAHDASAISFTPTGNLASTDVQAAIAEVSGDVTAHEGDTVDAHDASAISNTAISHVTGTDVQTVLAALPKGVVVKDLAGTDQTFASTTGTYNGASLTFTADVTRLYKVTFGITYTSSVPAAQADVYLRENGTTLGVAYRFFTSVGKAVDYTITSVIYQPTAGSKTLEVAVATNTGTSLALLGAAVSMSFFVEDVGLR